MTLQDDEEYASVSVDPPEPRSRGWKWGGRDARREIGAMLLVTVFLWLSVMPMRQSQERALRGLICLGLVVLAALLLGWAVKRTSADETAQGRAAATFEVADSL